jgi:hypothetical protein
MHANAWEGKYRVPDDIFKSAGSISEPSFQNTLSATRLGNSKGYLQQQYNKASKGGVG